jgi:hypothetical protein
MAYTERERLPLPRSAARLDLKAALAVLDGSAQQEVKAPPVGQVRGISGYGDTFLIAAELPGSVGKPAGQGLVVDVGHSISPPRGWGDAKARHPWLPEQAKNTENRHFDPWHGLFPLN